MVAIRGTVSDTLQEALMWLQNIDVRMINLERNLTKRQPESSDPEHRFSVHSGFASALNSLFAHGLETYLEEANKKCAGGNNKRVIVTGHSKGGAVGLLLALELLRCGWNVTLVTFGAPPSAAKGAAEFMSRCDSLQSFRLVNMMDIVPHTVRILDSLITGAELRAATNGTSLGLPMDRWLYHLGSPIVLDNFLMESFGMLAKAARAISLDKGLLRETCGAVVHHHSMEIYIENIEMYIGEPDLVKSAKCVVRAAK